MQDEDARPCDAKCVEYTEDKLLFEQFHECSLRECVLEIQSEHFEEYCNEHEEDENFHEHSLREHVLEIQSKHLRNIATKMRKIKRRRKLKKARKLVTRMV